jgi:hypothetical protein
LQVQEVTLSWIQNRASWGRRIALAALLSSVAVSASANVLVVRSSGPSARAYPAGRSLPDNQRLQLRAGDTLVVLDARGTRTFRGPGNFTAGTAAPGVRIADNDGRRARIGAVRSAGFVASSPTTIWHVDVSQSGNMCLASTSNVMLWRSDSSQAATLAISGPGGSRTIQWPAGRATLSWPADLPIANGGAYRLSQTGSPVPSTITFRTLDNAPSDMPGVAEALIRNGCQEQLDLLVDSAPTG